MPQINILAPHVADMIAAGEVVERPASVIKELMENSFDAGASAVTVEIKGGGATYIRVSDNGCGMAPEDAGIAFMRHATSKLRDEHGLEAIGTMGFRGEALAAISAVSEIELLTRRHGDPEGTFVTLSGGDIQDMGAAGCPEGTVMTVKGLFFNTPARLKFLKSDRSEASACVQTALRCALGRPEVSVRFIRDGNEEFFSPGDGRAESAIYSLLGRDMAKDMLPCTWDDEDMKLRGFISSPAACRGNRAAQYFYCNGRYIRSVLLQTAVEQAYKNSMLTGRFPACVLYLDIKNSAVDVNVHPAKTVVKFVSDKQVFDAVYYTVLDALDAENKPAPRKEEKPFYQTMTAQEYKAKAPVEQPKKPVGGYTVKTVVPSAQPIHVRDVSPQPKQTFTAPTPDAKKNYVITPPEPVAEKPVQVELPVPVQEAIEPKREIPWRIAGEVLKTYIICEDENDTVWLIDKHAAHERIRFDKLKESREVLMAQTLLTPVAVDLDADEYDAVLGNLPLLQEFAFACEDFGGGTVLVRQVPADIRAEDTAATLEELAHKLVQGRADPEAARDELLHTMACKSAIKAGMTSDVSELAALVEKVQSGEIQYCPHGRPVKYKLTKYEIEKFFKRA